MIGGFQPTGFQKNAFQNSVSISDKAFQCGPFQANAFQMSASCVVENNVPSVLSGGGGRFIPYRYLPTPSREWDKYLNNKKKRKELLEREYSKLNKEEKKDVALELCGRIAINLSKLAADYEQFLHALEVIRRYSEEFDDEEEMLFLGIF